MNTKSDAPMMEQLEERMLMAAGTVTVTYSPTSVQIKGDNGDNAIYLNTYGPGGTYKVTSPGATIIKTIGTAPVGSTNVNITVTLGSGSDTIALASVLAKNLKINTGGGASNVVLFSTFPSTIAGTTTIVGGAGVDAVTLNTGTFWKNVSINTGAGDDVVYIGSDSAVGVTEFKAGLSVLTGGGNDTVRIACNGGNPGVVQVKGTTLVDLGADHDSFYLVGEVLGNAAIFHGNTTLKFGDGNDMFHVGLDTANAKALDNGVSFRANVAFNWGKGAKDTFLITPGSLHFDGGLGKTVKVTAGLGTRSPALQLGLMDARWAPYTNANIRW
jgi:hypothetical protein